MPVPVWIEREFSTVGRHWRPKFLEEEICFGGKGIKKAEIEFKLLFI